MEFPRHRIVISRRSLLALPLVAVVPVSLPRLQQAATPVTRSDDGWPIYGRDLADTRASAAASITSATAKRPEPLWEVTLGGFVTATPVLAAGTIYVGAWDGRLYALDAETGRQIWAYDTGTQVLEPNLQIDLGIVGSAAVADGVVFVGDAAAIVHAVDAVTGEIRWTTTVDDQPAAAIWSSPIPWDGGIYIGVASIAKESGFRGSVVALDADSGDVLWQTFMVPEGADGAGVFAVPAIDPERGALYVGTQNAYSETPAPYGDPTSVVALDAATGERLWVFTAPPGGGETAPTEDVAFSASPNLFTMEIDGHARGLVGVGQKSGVYWALDRDSGEVIWRTEVAPAGPLGGMEGTAAVAEGLIAVPATDWPDPSGPAAGLVSVLNAADGSVRWTADRSAPVASPAAIGGDVAFQAGLDGLLIGYDLSDGSELWRADLGASVAGGVAVAGDILIVPAAAPSFAPFVVSGTMIRAFGLSSGAGSPAPSQG
ncbi:MAG: PQQ-binding-like beta-propeller repeat protein [Chloroflexi bacterium]|nr:PQQ-binding-like beta-propeller repeat protein [Chloroflexota bacterium]